jgi:hypothetical protein
MGTGDRVLLLGGRAESATLPCDPTQVPAIAYRCTLYTVLSVYCILVPSSYLTGPDLSIRYNTVQYCTSIVYD